jgi:O-acetyl-ADP-ribose deacetylase (regulator of RNase III)
VTEEKPADSVAAPHPGQLRVIIHPSRTHRLTLLDTSLLSVKSGLIVHGCNAQGRWLTSLGRAVREKWPAAYKKYQEQRPKLRQTIGRFGSVTYGTLQMGSISWIEPEENLWVVSAVTQFHKSTPGTRQVSYDAIAEVFRKISLLALEISQQRGWLPPIHMPAIGAGAAGGDARVVLELISQVVPPEIPIFLHMPRSLYHYGVDTSQAPLTWDDADGRRQRYTRVNQ